MQIKSYLLDIFFKVQMEGCTCSIRVTYGEARQGGV